MVEVRGIWPAFTWDAGVTGEVWLFRAWEGSGQPFLGYGVLGGVWITLSWVWERCAQPLLGCRVTWMVGLLSMGVREGCGQALLGSRVKVMECGYSL